MNIFLHCVFVEDEESLSSLRTSVNSLALPKGCDYAAAGFVSIPFVDRVTEVLKRMSPVKIDIWKYNAGKSSYVNKFVEELQPEAYERIFCSDSDIVWRRESFPNLMKHLEPAAEVVLPRQEGDNRHFVWNPTVSGDLVFLESNYGFSGGALLTTMSLIKKYPLPRVGSYGPEDVLWFRGLAKEGKKVAIVNSASVVHPLVKHKKTGSLPLELLKEMKYLPSSVIVPDKKGH